LLHGVVKVRVYDVILLDAGLQQHNTTVDEGNWVQDKHGWYRLAEEYSCLT